MRSLLDHLHRALRGARDERGFSLVELLIAMALISVGVAATIRVFGASDRTTLAAQHTEVGAHQAQLELDRLSKLEYGQLALSATPVHSTDPAHPNHRVSGTNFTTVAGAEPLVTTPQGGEVAMVDPGPQDFTVGAGGSAITGKIYRYVTWRDETCPPGVCDGTQDSKRLTVAVTVDASPGRAARAALWFSQVIPDPGASPGVTSGAGDSEEVDDGFSAQPFYLYDIGCKKEEREAPTASHSTRMTAGLDANKDNTSTCENGDAMEQPDLMGPESLGSGNPTLYKYSTDLSGTYPGGLAMMRNGSSCATSYTYANRANTSVPNKWGVHAWSTNKFKDPFILTSKVTTSIYTQTLGGLAGRGVLCATLIDRKESGGFPSDIVVGSATHDLAAWPTTPTPVTFGFTLASPYTVAKDRRLVLVLHLRGESEHDIAILYDHPTYPSQLEVRTSTPL